VEDPDRNEANGGRSPEEGDATSEPTGGAEGAADGASEETPDPEELKARLGIKDNHIRELFEQITASRLAADEARASTEASEGHIAALERDRTRLKERIRGLEEEARGRRRRRESLEREVTRLRRELERKDGEIARRDYLLERRAEEIEVLGEESEELAARKEGALGDALRRIEGLERDLEEREHKISELRTNIEELRADLEAEYELRERLAEPANRLRAGIDLFNDSEQRRSMNSLSRTLGQPEVHVDLDYGHEPAVLLTFTWQGVTWQTYAANPGLAVEDPRVYLRGAGEDLSGVDRRPPNARVGPGGRVLLGL
jgi:ribonuclease Y